MEEMCIAADSSFYICLVCDLKRINCINKFMDSYSFYFGKRILKEISPIKIHNENIFSDVKIIEDLDYYELIKPYFGRDEKHIDDGEYEAMGIAHFLIEKKYCLKYLIIDEKRARNFLITHFPYLKDKLVGTVGFIEKCSCQDKKISVTNAIELLESIKKSVKINNKKRPCSMDIKGIENIIIPCIKRIKDGCREKNE